MSEPTLTVGGERVTIPEARVLLGIPPNECFGCYLGDCAPQMHDLPDACDFGIDGGIIVTLPAPDEEYRLEHGEETKGADAPRDQEA